MRLRAFTPLCIGLFALASARAQQTAARSAASNLLEVKRVYVEPLVGGPQADAFRALIISSIDSSKLFILTDNEARADAILKGAADDHTFIDTFDSEEGLNGRIGGGGGGSSSGYVRSGGGFGGLSVGENESHHDKERKHEAYAAVRLCNRDGDVLWSTTQESMGAKFRSASADVAAKIARQLATDVDRARRVASTPASAAPPAVAKPGSR